jgi:hypothetical protein
MRYTIRPLDASTWDAFAELVERNHEIYGGCDDQARGGSVAGVPAWPIAA